MCVTFQKAANKTHPYSFGGISTYLHIHNQTMSMFLSSSSIDYNAAPVVHALYTRFLLLLDLSGNRCINTKPVMGGVWDRQIVAMGEGGVFKKRSLDKLTCVVLASHTNV